MTTAIAPPRPGARPAPSTATEALWAALAVIASVVAGYAWGEGYRIIALGAVGLAIGVAVVVLAVSRFRAFVLAAIIARSSLDALKLPGHTGADTASPAAAVGILFLGAAVVWMLARRSHGTRHPGSSLQLASIGLIVAGALSVPLSNAPGASASELVRLAAGVSMFFVVDRLVTSERDARAVLVAVFAASVVPLLVAAVAGNSLSETKDGISRLTATFTQSNPFAHFALVLTVVGAGLYRHVRRRARVVLTVLLVALLAVIVLTYTRNAWIGLAVGFVVVGIVDNRRLLAGALVAAALLAIAVPSVTGRFSDVTDESRVADKRENSLAWRFTYWSEVAPLADENPATGIGLRATTEATDEGKLPHNDYLRAYVETGFVGFLAYAAFIAALIATGVKALRRTTTGLRRGIAVGFLGYAIAFAIVSVVENLSTQVVILWYVMPVAALANWVVRTSDPVSETHA